MNPKEGGCQSFIFPLGANSPFYSFDTILFIFHRTLVFLEKVGLNCKWNPDQERSRKAFVKIYSLGGYQEANKVVELSAGSGKGRRPWPTLPYPCQNILAIHIDNNIYTSKIYHMTLSLKVPRV